MIFAEILRKERGGTRALIDNPQKFRDAVFATAQSRYKTISKKVRTAIIRSVIFILLTKFIFAFSVEATYDNIVVGHIQWNALIVNIVAPPILMIIASLFIRTPDINNTKRIYDKIMNILFVDKPELDRPLVISLKPDKRNPILNLIFTLLWWGSFVFIFYYMIHFLAELKFSPASQGIFVFFVAIIAFLTYRINQTAYSYTIFVRQNFLSPILDFFFTPIIKAGRKFTEGIAQINIFIYIFDYMIEMLFKEIFGFLEKWFFFLQT